MKTKLLLLLAFLGFGIAFGQNNNPAFSISNSSGTEGSSITFAITLAAPCNFDTVLSIYTTNGTAYSSSDFTSVQQLNVTIPAGQTTATVSVPTIQDTISEPSENFSLIGAITAGCNANPNSTNTATGVINDNDSLPIVTINGSTVLEGNIAEFFITLSNPSSTPIVISVVTTNQTATTADFAPVTSTITIPAGQTSAFISIPTLMDTIIELNETFSLCGVVTSGNTVNTNPCGVSVIIDNNNASISLSAIGTYNDFNNDGFTNVGDVINYQYTVTNTGQQVLSNVQVYFNQFPVSGGPIASLAIGAVDNTTFTSTYVITQADINAGYVYAGAYVTALYNNQQVANDFGSQTPLNISNGIKFNLFFDTNGNGVQNVGEQNYNGGNFSYQLNSGVTHSVTATNGMFTLYENNATNSYNLGCSLSLNNNYCNGQYALATTSYNNISVANGSGITTYNFPITTAPCTDLSVNLYQYGVPPRPGFTYTNRIQYTNNANQTITSGTITFTRSTTVSAVSTLPATTATATGFTYNFTNLLAGETRYIDVTMQVPTIPTVSLGDLVTNSVTASIPPNDAYPANNSASLTQVIVGSYDPNDKTESHGGKILLSSFTANDYLTYKIQFENTGTAEAVNIRVNDVLDAKLNPNTIRMVAASNPYVLDRVGNTLNWKFDGVNLPPSTPASSTIGHGYIIFQIKPTAGYVVGDIIPNIAKIYFDFNPAIVTDPCTTQFVSTLSINDFDANQLSVYPNPVQNNLTITNIATIDSVSVFSVLGREVMNQKVNALQAELNTSGLTNGVYFVKVTSEGKEKTVKVIKE
jgi:uncharacterized repeat protein (TIGR01451 family)